MELRLLQVADTVPTAPASLAASLRGLCGHVPLDAAVLRRGYRFFPMPGADLPSFLLKRITVDGQPAAAITLLCALDPRTGEAFLEDCWTLAAASTAIGSVGGGICSARLTVGPRTLTMDQFSTTFRHQDPELFMVIAGELTALAPLRQDSCALCRHAND